MTFQPTVPRGPVLAMFSSPGPIYALPPLVGYEKHDLRSTYSKAPAYQLGKRTEIPIKNVVPGPKYNFQYQPVFRDGKATQLNSYMFGRGEYFKHLGSAPGPAAYHPESGIAQSMPSPPKYTFGKRLEKLAPDQTPAANAYVLPPMLCRTVQSNKLQPPSYSMQAPGRDRDKGTDAFPGPSTYKVVEQNIYRNKPPAYSILKRLDPLSDTTNVPGPCAHYEERQWMLPKKTAASYSFGMRHSPYIAPLLSEVDD